MLDASFKTESETSPEKLTGLFNVFVDGTIKVDISLDSSLQTEQANTICTLRHRLKILRSAALQVIYRLKVYFHIRGGETLTLTPSDFSHFLSVIFVPLIDR